MVCAVFQFSSANCQMETEYGFHCSFYYSLSSSCLQILLCCWVLFAPRFILSPVSDFKFGAGSTYLILPGHLPNPSAHTTWARCFHWCCVTFGLQKGDIKYHAQFPRVPYSQGTLYTSCLFTMETAVWETDVHSGAGSVQTTVTLSRKLKQLHTRHIETWHAVSVGCVEIYKAQEKSQILSWKWCEHTITER